MTPRTLSHIPSDEISQDAAEVLNALADGRCVVRPGQSRGTVGVWWYDSPMSLAPGGPWQEVHVRERAAPEVRRVVVRPQYAASSGIGA